MRLPDGTGLDLLRRIDEAGRHEKAIVITAYGSPENAVEALKAGAYDYLTKPVDLRQFRAVVASALGRAPPPLPRGSGGRRRHAGRRPCRRARPQAPHPPPRRCAGAVGDSAAMQQVRSLVQKVARSMAPVLVHGESGTGKELVARAIHEVSRARRALRGRQLRRHSRATCSRPSSSATARAPSPAPTRTARASSRRRRAARLFLDEIGDLPLAMQSKLLRVIQERAVRRSARAETPVNVRIVSATHKDLGAEVQAGRFRQDLYYRLNVIRIACRRCASAWRPAGHLRRGAGAHRARCRGDAGAPRWPATRCSTCCAMPSRAMCASWRTCCTGRWRCRAATADRARRPRPARRTAARGEPDSGSRPRRRRGGAGPPGAAPAAAPDLAAYLDERRARHPGARAGAHRYNRTAAGASLGLSLRQMRYRMARLGVGAATARREPA
jgi:two-component system response regulator PilR (NtrC family)